MRGMALALLVVGGCAASPTAPASLTVGPTQASGSVPAASPSVPPDEGNGTTIAPLVVSPSPAGCTPTDQDQFVYNPARLQVVTACLQVTGTLTAIRTEADGDLHLLIALDPASSHLLTAANQGEELGDLVVEPVCVRPVSQADAIATCAADPDPLAALPASIGAHLWLQGRYVYDLQHGGWAELHPLYRWGPFGTAPPGSTRSASPTTAAASGGALRVRITRLASPISRGAEASLGASTLAGAACTITVEYKSGPSKAAGLGPETASASGALLWSWRVGSKTTPGTWPVTVRCTAGSRSASATAYLTVQ
jgi:hypothetical protein